MTKKQAAGRIGDDFEKYWAHYDVLSEGKIDASMSVPFLQALAHDSSLQCAFKQPDPKFCEKYGTGSASWCDD